MTPDEQKIAVAEAVGWTNIGFSGLYDGWHGLRPNGKYEERSDWSYLPDYDDDLNAMHEAEKHLLRVQVADYARNLRQVTLRDALDGTEYYWRIIHATAAQRCEAFLKTIGKWKEAAS